MSDKDEKQAEQTQLSLETAPSEPITGSDVDQGEVLEWTSHPVKRRPLVSVGVTIFVIISGILMYWSTQSNTYTVLTLVVLFASLAKFYFPTRYRMDSEEVTVKTTTQTLKKPWSMYRSYYPDKNGILLSPFAGQTRLESFRGLYIMCKENLDEVKGFVDSHINRSAEEAVQSADEGEKS